MREKIKNFDLVEIEKEVLSFEKEFEGARDNNSGDDF